MPPADSETPEVVLSEAEIEAWRQNLAFERHFEQQNEHRLVREGLFWHDERLDGLSDDDRMWLIIKMSFKQVAKVLERAGLVHYFEYFLQRGIISMRHLRLLTLNYLRTKMPKITEEEERVAIVDAAAECLREEDVNFPLKSSLRSIFKRYL